MLFTDLHGPKLYCIEPSGTSYGYWGCAAGKAKQAAKTEIEKINLKEKECKDLIKEAAKIIYQVHDEVKDKMFELELSWVTAATGGVHQVGLDYIDTGCRIGRPDFLADSPVTFFCVPWGMYEWS